MMVHRHAEIRTRIGIGVRISMREAPRSERGAPSGPRARAAEVAAGGWGEEVDEREVQSGGDAGGDLLGVVAGQSTGRTCGDPGHQVGADAGCQQERAEAPAERHEGGGLAS
jgi:hypothetical protein